MGRSNRSHDAPAWRVDLHTHTWHSLDSWMRPEALVAGARSAGLDRIAVTDHGTIAGALEARALDPVRIIVGQEIRCEAHTELIGLFLRERIPMGLSLEDAALRIRAQGGIVYAPHPYAYSRRAGWHAARALAVADLVEVFNSRAFLPVWNRSAALAASEQGLPSMASSDAHFPWELGRAHTSLAPFADAAGLLAVAMNAQPVAARTANPLIHVASVSLECTRKASRMLGVLSLPMPSGEQQAAGR
ncbi:MAG: PHP domain-containing protein [Longimicrobiales bacterium]